MRHHINIYIQLGKIILEGDKNMSSYEAKKKSQFEPSLVTTTVGRKGTSGIQPLPNKSHSRTLYFMFSSF
jgi:hypothetical protein